MCFDTKSGLNWFQINRNYIDLPEPLSQIHILKYGTFSTRKVLKPPSGRTKIALKCFS